MGGSSPKVPPAQVVAPRTDDSAVQEATAEAARRKSKARGYRSTIVNKEMMSDEQAKKLETLGS